MPRRPPKRYGFVRELLRPTRHGYIPPPRAALAAAEVYSKAFWGSAPSAEVFPKVFLDFKSVFPISPRCIQNDLKVFSTTSPEQTLSTPREHHNPRGWCCPGSGSCLGFPYRYCPFYFLTISSAR